MPEHPQLAVVGQIDVLTAVDSLSQLRIVRKEIDAKNNKYRLSVIWLIKEFMIIILKMNDLIIDSKIILEKYLIPFSLWPYFESYRLNKVKKR